MKFTGKKVVQIALLLTLTSTVLAGAELNTRLINIEYNGEIRSVKTIPAVSDDVILRLADIDPLGATISSVEVTARNINVQVFDNFTVNLMVDGNVETIETSQRTMEQLLHDLGITLGERDIIDVPLDTFLTDDTVAKITRVTWTQNENTQTIPYSTITKKNSSLATGKSNVLIEGENGSKSVTTETVYHDGVEISSYVISEVVLKNAVDKVVEQGTNNYSSNVVIGDGVISTMGGTLNYSQVITVTATAYSTEGWTSKYTASGTLARVGAIAVDPSVIPLGSKLYITSTDGKSWIYGTAVAEDTGGSIKGNKIDLFFNTQAECVSFGRKTALVYILS